MENAQESDWLNDEQPDGYSTDSIPVESDPWPAEELAPAPIFISRSHPSVTLYVDADNQSAQCAGPLLSLFGRMFAMKVAEAFVAGNNHGKEIDRWRKSLIAEAADIAIRPLDVPSRRQAADAALVMTLGQGLDTHVAKGDLVVVVSRDDFLIRAAEQARSRGCNVLLAYAGGEIPVARSTELTTLVLPAVKGPETAPLHEQGAQPASPTPMVGANPDPAVAATLAKLRETCTQQPGGGYAPSDVGQALTKLGYKKPKDRQRFLESVPGLETRGTGVKKVLVF